MGRLYSDMRSENIDNWYEDAEAVIEIFTQGKRIREFFALLECMKKEFKRSEKSEQEKKIYRLIEKLKYCESDMLLEALKRKGRACARNNELKKSLDRQMFRILELIRLGKKDMAVHSVLRTFTAHHKQVPTELLDTLREEYDINQFRAFMYSFLNNFIVIKSKKGEQENEE